MKENISYSSEKVNYVKEDLSLSCCSIFLGVSWAPSKIIFCNKRFYGSQELQTQIPGAPKQQLGSFQKDELAFTSSSQPIKDPSTSLKVLRGFGNVKRQAGF